MSTHTAHSPGTAIITQWLRQQGFQPFAFQQETWEHILRGHSGIVNAPTGCGKTFSVFLGSIIQFIDAHPTTWQQQRNNGLQLLWITPLRALAKDLGRAMQEAITGLGIPWKVGIRNGDTDTAERARQKKQMPEVLIITPESLHLLLAMKGHADFFKHLKIIAVDEWHELLGSKRGVQTELAVSYLIHSIKSQETNSKIQNPESQNLKSQIPDPTTQPKTKNNKPKTSNPEPQTSNLEHQTSNLKPRTSNLEHQTSNLKLRMSKTLFDKIWDRHVVKTIEGGPSVLYIDKHFIHEVTSPQAFQGLDKRGMKVFRPKQVVATADHNVPTLNQHLPIQEELSRKQVEALTKNCAAHDIELYGLGHAYQGIVHVIGPELGITQPGMTIVCGDSHTSTHGAFGSIAFGIGTSEVEMVLSTQCLLQSKPKQMRIVVDGELQPGVVSKDIILYIISKLSAAGGTGYFVEYAGSAIRSLSMEARMTICNMSIEMGARGGLIAPDETTFNYIKGRQFAPQGANWDAAVAYWQTLFTDADATFDAELHINAADIEPMITYGTNPGMGIKVTGTIPTENEVNPADKSGLSKALTYMGLEAGKPIEGQPIDYVFIGSCTNSRIEDLRMVADMVKGKQKAPGVEVWIVPGSKQVEMQARAEGIDNKVFEAAGFQLRQPGCSACLGMNEDKIPAGKYCISTSNRNFEGRQGPNARTFLASPLTAAAAALTGKVMDVREMMN